MSAGSLKNAGRPDLGWLVAKPIAHRGLHDLAAGVIENSPSAATAAIAGGFGIECDVQLTADGEAVVFHDFVLDRLTGETGAVVARKAAELGAITLKGSNDPILTLSAFLDLIGGRVPLVIEIKSRFDGDLTLTKRTVEVVAGYKGHPIVIKSFDPDIVAALRELAPEIPRGIVAMNAYEYGDYVSLSPERKHALANLLHFTESRPDFISWKVTDLESAAPYLCRNALGLPLMSWTVRTPEERQRAAAMADQMVFEGFRP
ncbi:MULTISPECIES: glycerophosphodiester phosphodiesterase family protein [Bosea]|uniref:glycerophosphodiester phosphodiesterase family protein n=1 Tax=Bosea TaxID=85413 RepID=UPI00214FC222|nr:MULTISPECIES: glycerophosphodiester phosphodiesterase family protein [Bosea]MCR4520797.1 glycerophosphodiester phosphodiesterase [Bosea sp. 47.2.35]MDR6828261.1 glycerophosphoryl diester phosphodiesterase [Bosea robiniae]MDR6894920.1 glycerophosphoryl diester phosphodiesterase [Bosea sp. BE109]MDR7138514.1 glycerophosphoryl diester phosphodiesterase [Bosea sp. BE168]MDR7175213.1 glycerophosphoryl diester phosphodiesterase [Bosea sp. BE271]